ncbi:MAG: carbon storage regulator CsrA [Bacillus sp. (in: firmicutes)]
MLVLTRKVGESIKIGDHIEITVVESKGDQIKLGIKAPNNIDIHRKEIYEAIQQANKEAVSPASMLPDFVASHDKRK